MMSGKISFKSLLADERVGSMGSNPYGYKEAQMNPDDTQFEQDFSKLAFMFVQDRAQGLMPYMLGFETVQRSPDGSKAVGIFGFKVGETYYYIPAFFMNNQVKGVDMILNKSTNMFTPLTEEWIDYITNNKGVDLGSGDVSEKVNEEFENPDFDFLQNPNVGSPKTAEYNRPYTLRQAWDVMRANIEASFEKDAEFSDAWVGFVSACKHIKCPLQKHASINDSILGDYVQNIGGPRSVISLMKMASSDAKTASSVLRFYDNIGSLYTDRFSRHCYLLNKSAEESGNAAADIVITDKPENEQQARDVIDNGFTVIDNRPSSAHSEIYSTEYDKKFESPSQPGIYNVLDDAGYTVKSYVLFKSNVGAFEPDSIVIHDGKSVESKSRDIIAVGDRVGTALDVYKKSENISSIEPHNTYVFVSRTGKCFGPFNVFGIEREPGKRVRIRGYEEHTFGHEFGDNGDFRHYWYGDSYHTPSGLPSASISTGVIELANIESDSAKLSGSKVVIPSTWGVFKINRDSDSELRLGDMLSLDISMQKKAFHRLDISKDGNDFFFRMDKGYNTPGMNYKQASIKLIAGLGLTPNDSKNILKTASYNGKHSCFVKLAQMSDLAGVNMGSPSDQAAGVDPYTGIPVYETPFEDLTEGNTDAPDAPSDNEQGENIGGDTSESMSPDVDQETKKLVQQAAQLGQKSVFDHAAVGGLSKVYDTGAVVDSYIPQFMQTLDRLGRILFLYYWKHDDFLGRYGSDDVVEMEDLLRGVFKSLGKLTMELKSKAISNEDAEAAAM